MQTTIMNMSREICVIKTNYPVYFPHSFFGGRMSNYVVVLNYDSEENLMILEYCPDIFKKKPTASCWLKTQTPLMAAQISLNALKAREYEIILRVRVSEDKYNKYVSYWDSHFRRSKDGTS